MKKKLEADLISIAHRVLQLKNKSDINQLYLETQKLYEKLAVLRFVDEHFSEAKPTIGSSDVVHKIESIFDITSKELEPEISEADSENSNKSQSSLIEDESINSIVATSKNEKVEEVTPNEDLIAVEISEENSNEVNPENDIKVTLEPAENIITIERKEVQNEVEELEIETVPITAPFESSQINEVELDLEVPKKAEVVQISFQDLLGSDYHETLFVKKQEISKTPSNSSVETTQDLGEPILNLKLDAFNKDNNDHTDPKVVSLNEKLGKGINIDLNDRLAFIKHLFGNSTEDYNRVLSQLITFDTFYDTRDFVQEMVKPDYNNWEGKQEYEDRFMDIIEKKFL
ncbi:hypothetical protein RCH18_001595 [Flavobacterium sp. PL11]|jgi:hypothetical protein|uniref:hypothetical protein n=1 Tax=Flavobacterium sp. PL11 TaxID=3071717 RepID=UPI002DFED27B|nr:hypothetical protein [Flavobacterium sp. PL11]